MLRFRIKPPKDNLTPICQHGPSNDTYLFPKVQGIIYHIEAIQSMKLKLLLMRIGQSLVILSEMC